MIACARESDVRLAARVGRFDDVKEHLRECALCQDTLVVALALQADEEVARTESPVPTADVVWIRAQLRARREAAKVAVRPLFVMQALGLACLVGAVVGVFGTGAWWLRSWATWLSSIAALGAGLEGSAEMTTLAVRGVALALAVWLVIAPVAVYLAAIED